MQGHEPLVIRSAEHDPKTQQRPISALFTQGESEDRQAAKPWHVQFARRRREARARGAVLQAALGKSSNRIFVGWVEPTGRPPWGRSVGETHRPLHAGLMGFARALPILRTH